MFSRLRYASWIAFSIFIVSVVAAGQAAKVRVTILHANDTYQFTPVDGGKSGGLARVLTLRKEIKASSPNLVFTFGGDTLSPSVETRTFKGAQMIDAWNAVDLDLAVLGNHEFDLKTDVLLQRIKESKFQWLGSNVIDTRSGKIFADTPPFVIKEFEGIKIGFVGFLLPETKETSSMESFLTVKSFCDTARDLVPKMKAAGADAVIAITHLFMRQDKELAGCAKFDLILGGHEHTLLQSSSNGTPIFKMTADARELGRFDLYFDSKSRRFESMDWQIIPVNETVSEAPEFLAVTNKYKDLLTELAVPVGTTAVELDATSVSNRTKETNIGNFIADSYRKAVNADVGLVNGGSVRADYFYKPGSLTKRDVLSILPFNNPIVKVEMTGALLLSVLEHGVARSGGEDAEPGRFPQVSGVRFTYDPRRKAGERIVTVLVGGKPLDRGATYSVATSDFLVTNGGDGYVMLKQGKVVLKAESAPKDSAVFETAITESPNRTIRPSVDGRITRIP